MWPKKKMYSSGHKKIKITSFCIQRLQVGEATYEGAGDRAPRVLLGKASLQPLLPFILISGLRLPRDRRPPFPLDLAGTATAERLVAAAAVV